MSRSPVNVPSGTKQKTKNNYHTNKSNHYEINEKQHIHANPYPTGFCSSKQGIPYPRFLERAAVQIHDCIIQNNRHKVLAIGGTADHVHILIGMRPSQSLSELMQHVKGCSSKWINENRLANGWFSWQEGYGAFSYSKDEIPTIIRYIENQAEHHKQQDMVNEYKMMLEESEVEYDEQKIFKQVD